MNGNNRQPLTDRQGFMEQVCEISGHISTNGVDITFSSY